MCVCALARVLPRLSLGNRLVSIRGHTSSVIVNLLSCLTLISLIASLTSVKLDSAYFFKICFH